MKPFIFIITALLAGFLSCHKKPVGGNDIFVLTPAPYTEPQWHPSGTLLGYNYHSDKHPDSTGYYVIKADGSGKTNVLNYRINCAQWSKDGKWLAYSYEDNLYKVPFDGTAFQLSKTVQLTQSGRNYFPSWNDSGDSLVYDSNVDAPEGGYRLWKMAADGSGKTLVTSGRMPLWAGTNIYFIGKDATGVGIMQLLSGTNSVSKVVNQPTGTHNITTLRTLGAELFYQMGGIGIYRAALNGGSSILVSSDQLDDLGYDISSQGRIAYVWYSGKVSATEGTIWLINKNGSGKIQLTFNSY